MPFEITLEGNVYTTDRLTVAEAVELEKALGKNWAQLNPVASAEEFQAFVTVLLRRDHPPDQAIKIAAELPLSVALNAAQWVDDDLPVEYEDGHPKKGGGPSTTTSSTSPARRTAGRRTSPDANP